MNLGKNTGTVPLFTHQALDSVSRKLKDGFDKSEASASKMLQLLEKIDKSTKSNSHVENNSQNYQVLVPSGEEFGVTKEGSLENKLRLQNQFLKEDNIKFKNKIYKLQAAKSQNIQFYNNFSRQEKGQPHFPTLDEIKQKGKGINDSKNLISLGNKYVKGPLSKDNTNQEMNASKKIASDMREKESQIKSLKDQLQQALSEKGQMYLQIQRLRADFQKEYKDRMSAIDQLEKLKGANMNNIREKQKEKLFVYKDLQVQKQNQQRLRQQLDQSLNQISSLKATMEQNNTKQLQAVSKSDKLATDMENSLKIAQEKVDYLKKENINLIYKLKQLQQENSFILSKKENCLNALQKELDQVRQNNSVQRQDLKNLDLEKSALFSENNDLKAKLEDLNKKLDKTETQKYEIKTNLLEWEQKYKKHEQENNQIKSLQEKVINGINLCCNELRLELKDHKAETTLDEIEQTFNRIHTCLRQISRHLLFDSQVISNQTTRRELMEITSKAIGSQVLKTRLMYQSNYPTKKTPSNFVSSNDQLLLLVRTKNGKILGAFCSNNTPEKKDSKGFIFHLGDEQKIKGVYYPKDQSKKILDVANDSFAVGLDLRLVYDDKTLTSNINKSSSTFIVEDVLCDEFIGQEKTSATQTFVQYYEIYQIVDEIDSLSKTITRPQMQRELQSDIKISQKRLLETKKLEGSRETKILEEKMKRMEVKSKETIEKLQEELKKKIADNESFSNKKNKELQDLQFKKNVENKTLLDEINRLKLQTQNKKAEISSLEQKLKKEIEIRQQAITDKTKSQENTKKLMQIQTQKQQLERNVNQKQIQLKRTLQSLDKESKKNLHESIIKENLMKQLQEIKKKIQKTENQLISTKKQAQQADSWLAQANNKTQQAESKIQMLETKCRQTVQKLEQVTDNYDKKLMDMQNMQNHDLDVLLNTEILLRERVMKQFLIQTLEKTLGGTIANTKLIYKFDELNTQNFHLYIDGHPNILLLVKTQKGKVLAAFSEDAFEKDSVPTKQGLLFALKPEKNQSKCFKMNQKNKQSKAHLFDPYLLIFGNSELRLKANQKKIFSNFGLVNNFYETKEETVNIFFEEGDKTKQVAIETYEVYEIQVKNE